MDDARLLAWIDGELPAADAAEVEAAVAADPALAARAEAHRSLQRRFTAAFAGIAEEPVALPRASVVSLADFRAARAAPTVEKRRNWGWPGALAASLLVGLLVGHQVGGGPVGGSAAGRSAGGVGDTPGALALAAPVADALDHRASGEAGPIRVALSFRDRSGDYCRSFSGQALAGVACRADGDWQLRYAAPAAPAGDNYRMAGGDPALAQAVGTLIAGEPLDAAQEKQALAAGWR